MYTQPERGDAAAVARDALESAKARNEDIVIIDTAGRMQNKTNLMEELRKVHSVTRPHLVLFVADALAGNDAVIQAKEFQRMLSFDGAVLCKLERMPKEVLRFRLLTPQDALLFWQAWVRAMTTYKTSNPIG